MDDGEALFLTIGGFLFGIFLFVTGFWNWKMLRLIRNLPTSKIRSLAMGIVEIRGKAKSVPAGLLTSPFTSTKCVWYRYVIEEYRKSGKHSRWVTLKQWASNSHFYLEDDTGKVLVDPKRAYIEVSVANELKSNTGKDPPAEVKAFLESQNMAFEGFLGINKTMRYREWLITPEKHLYILGTAGKNPYVKEGTAQQSAENIMIQRGRNVKFYHITEKDEKGVIQSMRTRVALSICGGGALAIVCLFFIFLRFGLL